MRLCRLAFVFPVLSLGCASLSFKAGVQSVGEYKNTLAVAEKANDMPTEGADDVKVLLEALPEGMRIHEGEIVFDKNRYEMLGKVTAEYRDPAGINLGWWFYHYQDKDSWRQGLCAWQVPLSWVTLSMWSYFVPLYYPCRVHMGDEDERRASAIATLQRATKALGGNLVVVAGFGGIDFLTVSGRSGVILNANSVGTLRSTGYAFKVKLGEAVPAGAGKAVNL